MFGLDPDSVVARVKASGKEPFIPCLRSSLLRGTLGFTVVSLGGFAPWMFLSGFFRQIHFLPGMFVACAAVFIGLSGLLLRGLLVGPDTYGRFYKTFGFAFAGLAVGWIACVIATDENRGNLPGFCAGACLMGLALSLVFGSPRAALAAIPVLVATSLAGCYIGGWVHEQILAQSNPVLFGHAIDRQTRIKLSQAVWGLFFGLGLGPGIGAAFYVCQAEVRKKLQMAA